MLPMIGLLILGIVSLLGAILLARGENEKVARPQSVAESRVQELENIPIAAPRQVNEVVEADPMLTEVAGFATMEEQLQLIKEEMQLLQKQSREMELRLSSLNESIEYLKKQNAIELLNAPAVPGTPRN